MSEIHPIAPVQVWPLASFLAEEMQERGWTAVDVAARMPGDYATNVLTVNLVLAVQDAKMVLDRRFFDALAAAFGVSAECFQNLHNRWLRWPNAREPFTCPGELLDGVLIPNNDASPTPSRRN